MFDNIANLIPTIFYQVLYMTVIGSIFGLIFFAIRNIFDKKISGKIKCFIWMIILLTFIIPIRFEITLETNNENKVITQVRDIKDTSESVLMSRIESIKEISKNEDKNSQKTETAFTDIEKIDNTSQNTKTNETNIKDILLKTIIPYLWILGFVTFIITFIIGNRKLKKRISKNIYIDDRIDRILNEVKYQLNIKRKIKVVKQDYKKVPSIFGVFNPVILITEDTLKEDDTTLKYIFLHELSHYKRMDLVFNYILVLVLSIHWFNPVVWILFNKIRQDIELGADELATKRLDKIQRKEYGMTLINLIKNCTKENYTASMLCITDNEKNLERRILMIKGKTKTAIIAIIITIVVLGVAAGIVLVKFNDQKSFSQMEKLSGPGSSGLITDDNTGEKISSEEKQEIETYINKICNPTCVVKIDEFKNINEASKKWIYSHLESTNSYLSEEEIKNNLQELFGTELVIDIKNDIASTDDVVMPTYDKTTQKYALPTFGMDNVPVYTINNIIKSNNQYVVNVIEYNEMSDLYESDNNHELIISAYDENIEKTWKWKEIFRVSSDTSEDEIVSEVLKRKDDFLSYDILMEKDNNKYVVKEINKVKNIVKTVKTDVENISDNSNENNLVSQNNISTNVSAERENILKKMSTPLNCEYEISAGFHGQANHTGIDYKANEGEKILAAMDGKIILSKYKGSYGNLVVIDHGDGVQTYYAHCSKLLKQEGETVSVGEEIAEIGSTGNATGTCLHFEMRIDGNPVNPTPYVK